jgi:hypothetical protein
MDIEKCFECDSEENIIKHHVVPRIKGGKRTVHLCQECHDKVHNIKTREISISTLTKIGIERARKRGVKLGNPKANDALSKARAVIQSRKTDYYLNAIKVIQEYREKNDKNTLTDMAEYLMSIGYKTPRNGMNWTETTVRRILKYKN